MKLLLIPLLLFAFVIPALSQPGAHAKGGGGASSSPAATAPANASSPAASTGSQQTGYVYRLPYRYHIHYGWDSVSSIPAGKLTAPGNTTVTTMVTKTKITCDEVVKALHPTEPETEIRGLLICKNIIMTNNPGPPTTQTIYNVPVNSPASIQNNVYMDSLSRYWQTPRGGRHRLRVGLTQADSGRILVSIYDNNFPIRPKIVAAKDIDDVVIKTGTDSVMDYGIPISALDADTSFYIQINNRQRMWQPIAYISLPYALTQYGAMTIPFKYRWAPRRTKIYIKPAQNMADSIVAAPSESTGSINVAFYVGRKWGRTRFYFDPTKTHNTISFMASGFIGPSLVSFSSSNIAYPHTIDSLPSSALAVSVGGAATIEWKGIDLGLFGGADYCLTARTNWIYNRKFWLGFGIGVNLGMFASGPTQVQL